MNDLKFSIEETDRAYEALLSYTGHNPFIVDLCNRVRYGRGQQRILNEFETEYVLKNVNYQPVMVRKVFSMEEKWAVKQMVGYNLPGPAIKIYVDSVTGETEKFYSCFVLFSKQVQIMHHIIIPKYAFITPVHLEDFIYAPIPLDFTRYNQCLQKINPGFSVMDHQKRSVDFLLRRKKGILSLEQGLGKSLSSIVACLEHERLLGHSIKVLIICPASLKTNWKHELSTFVPETDIALIKSIQDMTREELIDFLGVKKDTDLPNVKLREVAYEKGKWNGGRKFTILNYDIIEEFHQLPESRKKSDVEKALRDSTLLAAGFDVVIIDEAHRLSNASGWFKVINNFLKRSGIQYVWLLTGTMITNNPRNLYNVLSIIKHPVTENYDAYMKRYCDARRFLLKGEWDKCWERWSKGRYPGYNSLNDNMKQKFKEYVDKYGRHRMDDQGASNLSELAERISDCYFRVTKKEIPGFVKKDIIVRTYTMTEAEQRRYANLWDEYVEDMKAEGKDVNEDLQPLLENNVCRRYISTIMLDKTVDLVNQLLSEGNKVFVACAYNDEVFGLQEKFGDQCVIYKGGLSASAKDEAVERFNNDDACRVFIGNTRAAGVGLNLNKSCHIAVFQNLDYTPSDFGQVCDRIHRLGSKEDVQIYVQYFEDTVYEGIWKIIERKEKIINQVVR